MIKTLGMNLKIDIAFSVNSFIYSLRKLPIFRDLFTDDIYKNKALKKIIGIFGLILSFTRMLVMKGLYFLVIYLICIYICPTNLVKSFIHVFFVFSIIGMFINNKLLIPGRKKYTSIVLFNMDACKYMRAIFWYNLFLIFIFNTLLFVLFKAYINYSLLDIILLVILTIFTRITGESFNIWFYRKYKYLWHNNTILYFSILIFLLLVSSLPFFNIFINKNIMFIFLGILLILSIIGLVYLYNVHDYKIIFKHLNTKAMVMSSNGSDYSRQEMLKVRNRDKDIDSGKIKGKKGYDLFNTIFFERHREILYRSAKKYALVISVIVIVLAYFVVTNGDFAKITYSFLDNHLAYFVIIMYFINRGSIITQAMFYNCDHAMLTYNFYREPDVILGLFKKRLMTVVRVNLVPAIVVGLGIDIILYLSGGLFGINCITSFLFIIILSVFFSVHHLVLYYLLQPYNKDMQVKKISYSVVSIATYFIAYSIKDLVMSSLLFSIIGIVGTILYIVIAIWLVYKRAPYTFRLN